MKTKVYTATEVSSMLIALQEVRFGEEHMPYHQELIEEVIIILEGGVSQEGFNNDSL